MPILEVRELRKQYGATAALADVSLHVEDGEMFGLLGPNGAGKTTLLSIISGLVPADGGEVQLLGKPLRQSGRDWRRLIGIVPQELAVYGELTSQENLEFFGRLYGLSGRELRDRTADILKAIGLADRAHERVQGFSGGMKRRLNLGAALVHQPRLLLLDEPTTGVDPQSRNHIFEEVRRLNQSGMTVVYTSHYMEEVQALCTRIGIMDHGRVIACDALPSLLRQLEGSVYFRVDRGHEALLERVRALPGAHVIRSNGTVFELGSAEVKLTLIRLLAVLNELGLELTSLETNEPNLERVFLHLTGHALRD